MMGCECYEGECNCTADSAGTRYTMRTYNDLTPAAREKLDAVVARLKSAGPTSPIILTDWPHPALVEAAKLRAMVAELEARNKVLDHELDLVLATVHDAAPDLFATLMTRVVRS